MEEVPAAPQLEHIHFPRQIGLIKKLRFASFVINDTTIGVSLLTILIWLASLLGIRFSFFQQNVFYPFTPVLFLLACVPLFFGAKKHLIETHHDAEKDTRPNWIFGVPLLFATLIVIVGFINLLGLTRLGVLSLLHTSPFTGLCFFLIGLSLIPPYILIPHRFHITQFLVFIVSGLNVFVILENIYQFFFQHPAPNIDYPAVLASCSFALYSLGLLFRWSNRGFLGNFTLDATASIFALRVFLINLLAAPLIAFIVLLLTRNSSYNMYQILTLVVVCFAFISSLLLWMNVKILYGHELEHLLMRETLRFHNIDLTKEEEKLQKKMAQIEQEKQQYLEKLKSQNAWQDAAERLG